jgi:hypothetical protein
MVCKIICLRFIVQDLWPRRRFDRKEGDKANPLMPMPVRKLWPRESEPLASVDFIYYLNRFATACGWTNVYEMILC